jgi:hypothetical protein
MYGAMGDKLMEKSPSLILTILSTGIVLSVDFNSVAFADKVQDEFEGQQFLFLITEGYNQEQDELQVSFTSRYMDRQRLEEGDEIKTKNQWEWTTSVEYGLWDWLEFEVEIPFSHIHKQTTEDGETTNLDEAGISDIETGICINLFEEEQDKWWSHTISAGFEVSWPSGRWRKDLGTDQFGWETNLVMSKTTDKWAYHLLGGFGTTNDAREQEESEKSDIEEFEAGGALVYMATDRLDIICELFSEFEKEKNSSSVSHETEFYIIPGVGYERFENFEVGLGVPIGLTDESHDWGIIAKIQYEW